jgi:hypothetical protein
MGLSCYNAITANGSITANESTFSGIPSANGTTYASFQGDFMLPVLSPENTTSSLTNALTPLLENISSTYPGQFIVSISNVTTSPTFYDWWFKGNKPANAGTNSVIGSRLIGADALHDTDALETALKGILPDSGLAFYLLGGKGLANSVPSGGSNAVNPAWRRAIVHASSYPLLLSCRCVSFLPRAILTVRL